MKFLKKKSEEEPGSALIAESGRVRRWVAGKPKLAANVQEVVGESVPRPNVLGILSRLLLLVAGFILLVLTITWLLLGVTVMPTLRVGDESWMVKRALWTQGGAPVGEKVVALTQPVERGPLDRLELLVGGGGERALLTIVAQPKNKIAVVGGRLTVDGATTLYPLTTLPNRSKTSTYLAECNTGACGEPGTLVTIPTNQVLGQAAYLIPTPFLGVIVSSN